MIENGSRYDYGFEPEEWDHVPALIGRVATQGDVDDGAAAFALGSAAKPYDMPLPRPAFWNDEDGRRVPVVIIQAEQALANDELILIGMITPDGDGVVATLPELEILDAATGTWLEAARHVRQGASND